MRKILLTLMILAFLASPVFAMTQKQIQFVDEWGDPVNMGTSVSIYIYDVTTTNEQTCYTNRTGATAYLVAQAVEDNSTNTPLDYTTGLLTFWSQEAGYKLTVTDGTYTRTVDNLNASITRFSWPSYLVAMSSRTVGDDQTWIIGSETDVTFDWVDLSTKMTITAAADATIDIGADDFQFDVKFYADSDGDFILWDNDDESLEYVGAQAHFDDDSEIWIGTHMDFKIESATTKVLDILPLVGDETYKVNIGATTAGADLKVWGTDGTDYIEWDASADLHTIVGDAVAWTLTEAATTAVNIDITGADGGFDLDTTDGPIALTTAGAINGDMTLTVADKFILISTDTAAAGIDIEENGGTAGTIHLHANQGTSQAAINLLVDDGGVTVTATEAIDDGAILLVNGAVATGSQLWGGVYGDINIDGTTDGPVYGVAGILWPGGSSAPASIIAGGKFGVNETSADLSGATVCGIVIENLLATGGADPLNHYMMYFNTSSAAETPTAWFNAVNVESVAATIIGGETAAKTGVIKVVIQGTTHYIRLYNGTG